MSHVIHSAMIARRRNLRDNDGSSYSGLRLVVQRQGHDKAVCSIIHTAVGGQRLLETQLAFAQIPVRDAQGRPLDAIDVLTAALEALRRQA